MKMKNQGFTLVEVMLASVLCLIILLGSNLIYGGTVQQERAEGQPGDRYVETRILFEQFRNMIELSTQEGATAPEISLDALSLRTAGGVLETSGKDVVYTSQRGEEVVLAEDTVARFDYLADSDRYRMELVHNGSVLDYEQPVSY